MTLIASLRCSEGAVVCADSQETVGNYRVTRQKLEPFTAGNFEFVVAGSGEDGDLIDAVVQRFKDNLPSTTLTTLPELKDFFREELLEFNKQEAAVLPKKYRRMKFVIAARSQDPPSFDLWETSSSRLIRIDKWSLIGREEEIYKRAVGRLFATGMPH